ncbi:SatD family protein [Janibacter hoylei]|uniref:SatD family protein n=1 Tax=Janibacter hoylei TaxID=364298 RepID=UPI0021A50B4C|nr:SatD family protein [Janibacter hoylei]MCT1618109.1 SatD family protein [Janibacter hoylei]MCT2292270.1 SatD family protein [Janibacter hoylei]
MTSVATLIGDVVGSRSAADRRGLHARLEEVIATINATTDPVHPVRITVGDEFQGAWARRGQAVHAALLLRTGLLPEVETRYGLGHGEVTALSDDGTVQDGPGWWLAREAIILAKDAESAARADSRVVRTRWREDSPTGTALDAALQHRDLLLADLDERSHRLLRGLLHGTSQRALAEAEAVSPTAVSRRVHRDALDHLVRLDADLGGLP